MITPESVFPVVCYGVGLIGFVLIWGRGPWILHPAMLFIPIQASLVLGTALLVDSSQVVHLQYLWILAGGNLLYLAALLGARAVWPIPHRYRMAWRAQPCLGERKGSLRDSIAYGVLGVSVLVSIIYFMVVGYNLFLESIPSILSGGGVVSDVETRRLEAYSGSNYYAPGYVNQFKNILLPALTAVIVIRYTYTKAVRYFVASLLLVPTSVIFLLGTGQRGAFVIAAVGWGIFAAATLPRRLAKRALLSLSVIGIILLAFATISLGRQANDEGENIALEVAGNGIWSRIIREQQLSGLAYHERFASESPVWGVEWGARIKNILPGKGEPTSDNEVHAILYGSDRGTAPATLWGSVWHNFGGIGLLLFPVVLASFHHWIYRRAIFGPKSDLRMAIFATVCAGSGFWVVGGPDFLVEGGLITMAILSFLLYGLTRSFRSSNSNLGRRERHSVATHNVGVDNQQ